MSLIPPRNSGHHRDHPNRRPLHLLPDRSPEASGHVRADAEPPETAALRTLLSRRREGAFVDAEGMDARLTGMIIDKCRAQHVPT